MSEHFRVGRWIVRPQLGEMECGDKIVQVKPRIMDLLVCLARHPGEVLSKAFLFETLWKGAFVSENTLVNAVSELRKALNDDAKEPLFIKTHSKRGYRLIATVSGVPEPEPDKPAAESMLRLAVLPFEGLGEATGSFLPQVITEMVTDQLAASGAVKVVSRTSARICRKEAITLPEGVRRLEVERVLEGSVLRSQEALWVTVRLFNAADERLRTTCVEMPSTEDLAVLRDLAWEIVEDLLTISWDRAAGEAKALTKEKKERFH